MTDFCHESNCSDSGELSQRNACYLCGLTCSNVELENHQEECYATRLGEWEEMDEKEEKGRKPITLTEHHAQQFKRWDDEQQAATVVNKNPMDNRTTKGGDFSDGNKFKPTRFDTLRSTQQPTKKGKRIGLVRSRVMNESKKPSEKQQQQVSLKHHVTPIRAPTLKGRTKEEDNNHRSDSQRNDNDVIIGTTVIQPARLVSRTNIAYHRPQQQPSSFENTSQQQHHTPQSYALPSNVFTGLPNKPTSVLVQGRSENIACVVSKGEALRLPGILTAARAMNSTERRGLVKPLKRYEEEEEILV